MKFKTNAKCIGCSTTILNKMRSQFPDQEWSLDLESADKVLEAHGMPDDPAKAAEIEAAIASTGFNGSWLRPAAEY
ncbi:MAG: heavy metal transport/detoxification protein [Bacteroides sp.]|nr:heavy metal transport/detoxification protein [Bacteroides sp.]